MAVLGVPGSAASNELTRRGRDAGTARAWRERRRDPWLPGWPISKDNLTNRPALRRSDTPWASGPANSSFLDPKIWKQIMKIRLFEKGEGPDSMMSPSKKDANPIFKKGGGPDSTMSPISSRAPQIDQNCLAFARTDQTPTPDRPQGLL